MLTKEKLSSLQTHQPHTHREYDAEGRVVLEVFEDDTTRVVETFQYEGDWTIREQKHLSKDSEVGFLCIERFKNDGSARWSSFFYVQFGFSGKFTEKQKK